MMWRGPMAGVLAFWVARSAAAQAVAAPLVGTAPPSSAQPGPADVHYLQYGVGIALETVVDGGDVCPRGAAAPCIFGSGGGLAIRVGYRSRGPWYFGSAYEVSRHQSANLLRLAILQQLRGEIRYYLELRKSFTPYFTAGAGAAAYGNEFAIETGGLTGFLGVGGEYLLSRTTILGAALVYRPFLFRGWTDSAMQRRGGEFLGFGFAHVIALEFQLELRDPLSRW